MFAKPVRRLYYWILRRGWPGYIALKAASLAYIGYVRLFRIKPGYDLSPLVIVSHRYRFIFIGIPKVATRSFMDALVHAPARDYAVEWDENRDFFYRVLAQYPDYYKFSFVRNPYSRIVSCFNSKIDRPGLGKKARYFCFYDGLKPGMDFYQFAQWLNTGEGRDAIADRHWMAQYRFVYDESDHCICDFVGHYENLDNDLATVSQAIGVDLAIGHGGFVSATRDLSHYYDDETRRLITDRYARDFALFGYDSHVL